MSSPGFIDPHVHIYLPFMGTRAKDTHESASKAALVGRTTTFIEMICPGRDDQPMDAFELWLGKAQGASGCDFSFHMGVTRYDEEAERVAPRHDLDPRDRSRAVRFREPENRAAAISPKFPTASRRSKTGSTSTTPTA